MRVILVLKNYSMIGHGLGEVGFAIYKQEDDGRSRIPGDYHDQPHHHHRLHHNRRHGFH